MKFFKAVGIGATVLLGVGMGYGAFEVTSNGIDKLVPIEEDAETSERILHEAGKFGISTLVGTRVATFVVETILM